MINDMTRHARRIGLTERRNMKGYLFILPVVIGLAFLFLPMFAKSIWYSFCDLVIADGGIKPVFIGTSNFYKAFFADYAYLSLLGNTVGMMIADTIVILMFSFFIANVLNQKFFGRAFARTVFFLPVIVVTGIIAASTGETFGGYYTGTVANDIFGGNTGREVLTAFGESGVAAFFDLESLLLGVNLPLNLAGFIVDAVNNTYSVVNNSGVQILLFIAALQSIPQSIFEASRVEGATKWEEFWKITFPIMTPTLFVALFYTVIDSFVRPSYGMMFYINKEAFVDGHPGYAAALGVIYMTVILIILLLVTLIMRKRIYYEN